MLKKIEVFTEETIFKSRWLLVPFYLGLVLSIILLFVKFVQEFWHLFVTIGAAKESEVIVAILALVDMSLVASLLLMVIFSGYEIFVSKIDVKAEDRPSWMGKVNFSGLKLKVIGAIVAISAIDMLKSYMEITTELTEGEMNALMWKVIIHMAFVISGVIFALTDKIAGDTKQH